MSRKPYCNDLTDQEWTLLEPLIPAPKRGGRPRTADMREVLNAIIYVLKTGCQWDQLPHDYPPKGTVYHDFNTWRKDGTWARMNGALREQLRRQLGRKTTPSAGRIDRQCVKTTETEGVLLTPFVSEAHDAEGTVGVWLRAGLRERFPRLKMRWADGTYGGQFVERAAELGINVEITTRLADHPGFQVIPRRWVAERTFAW